MQSIAQRSRRVYKISPNYFILLKNQEYSVAVNTPELHTLELGIMQWLEQQNPRTHCIDIMAGGKTLLINEDMLIQGPMVTWIKEQPT